MLNSTHPFIIEDIYPSIDNGKYPVKREVGETFTVQATVFRDGHDVSRVILKHREKHGDEKWHESEMEIVNPGLDLWQGGFDLKKNARYQYTIEAYTDIYQSWLRDAQKKIEANQDIKSELIEGGDLINEAIKVISKKQEKEYLKGLLLKLESSTTQKDKLKMLSCEEFLDVMNRNLPRNDSTTYEPALEVVVDRVKARFAAWYEMFPRSQGTVPGKSATFKDCIKRLPEIKEMGFDVVYLVPIHPIGKTNRKGPNNTLAAGPDDPGSPYAIGAEEGGHMSVEPGLGTIEDFVEFEKACRKLGMEVALDFAINCSPDHPYVKEHPEWFFARPDRTIKCAENPPKKYEDIYPLNFYAPDEKWKSLWEEMKKIFLFWIEKNVRIFRVDNPHTKPIPFWRWLINTIQKQYPDVIFLSEAFTKPPMMKALAKVGFTQSYTYFTWRNFKDEFIDYFTELTQTEMSEYFRGNLWTNTPDILPQILQEGGRAAFKMRFVLASTLSSVYGIYSGFELCESAWIEGKEEYLNSEKYEYKVWDWARPGNIKDFITKVNKIRRENPALRLYRNLRFYQADNDNILFYGKSTKDKKSIILVAVNLDPFHRHECHVDIPLEEFGLKSDETFELHELITGERFLCKEARQHISLDPKKEPAHIYNLEKWVRKEEDFDYFGM